MNNGIFNFNGFYLVLIFKLSGNHERQWRYKPNVVF
jgi:hypothetical protein